MAEQYADPSTFSMDSFRLDGKVALVTGASYGIGFAIATALAKAGAKIAFNDINAEKAEMGEKAYAAEGIEAKGYVADVTNVEQVEKLVADIKADFGTTPDILVNNAGIMDDMSPVGDATDEKYEQVMAVNVYGPLAAMRAAVNAFKASGTKGSIVNVASVGGMRSCAGAVYCASKAALISLTKNTAYMYMADGIRTNCIAPGGIVTEIATSMGVPNPAGYGRIKPVLDCAPAPGSAEEIAAAALFLASDAASYVNGVVLPVDGGWMAG